MAKKTDDVDIMPEDSNDADYDVSELRVDFSDKEASAQVFEYQPVPSGKYLCTITEWSLERSTSEKHNGKPYWALRLRVNDDNEKYAGRLFFANVMLFEGALYSLAQLDEALAGEGDGWGEVRKTGKIPHGDTLIGKEVIAVVEKKVDKYKIDKGEWDPDSGEPRPYKNEVRGFKPVSAGASNVGGGSGSLLPG